MFEMGLLKEHKVPIEGMNYRASLVMSALAGWCSSDENNVRWSMEEEAMNKTWCDIVSSVGD